MTLHSSLLSVTCPMSLGAIINLYKKQLAMQGSRFPFFFLWPSSEAWREKEREELSCSGSVLFPIFLLLFLLAISRAQLITISGLKTWFAPRSGWQKFLAAVLLLLWIFLLCCFWFGDSPLFLHDRVGFLCWYQLNFSQLSSLRLQRSWAAVTFHLFCFPPVAHI